VRRIGVVTVARSDFGILTPVLHRIVSHPDLELRLIASGAHLSSEFGRTVDAVTAEGFRPDVEIPMLLSADTPDAIAISTGLGVIGFAQYFAQRRPDLLVVLGDRFEMYAAALAALPFHIPVAHIHGGERSEGAIDDALRHSMTKLSHLHFVATGEYARRVAQLGEEEWRISVCGAPALDVLDSLDYMSVESLEAQFKIRLEPLPILVTFHPVTLKFESVEEDLTELLEALEMVGLPVVFTRPNADTNGRRVMRMIEDYARTRDDVYLVDNFGSLAYFSMMRIVRVLVGNSSSGLIEAPSFSLPVVNIGDRQRGRVRGENVIDVAADRDAIATAIGRATSPEFRSIAKRAHNPYRHTVSAGEIIVERLATTPLDERLIMKRFRDTEASRNQ
jgi:UDP-hydrolysing UDP-N-acetyl-D-glucosamine 2-epimerase